MAKCNLGVAILSCLLLFPFAARGEDYFLTIGGGYSPTGNQISLEKNVLLFQRLLQEEYPGTEVSHDIFFSDGDDPARDLQFAGPAQDVPKVNRLLARVFQQTRYLDYEYRTHEVPGVRGGTTRENIAEWFEQKGSQLRDGDRLFIYVTAHGSGSSDKNQPQNTKLMLWNNQALLMSELTGFLDKLRPEVRVVLVMVQCYSGGFANVIFEQGQPAKGMAACDRCGFFATVHDRPAAGCTPDISEENYREYSTYFWEAIRGRTRTGDHVDRPDYDGDGMVSFDEAHAYALIASSTIDISVKTSDAFLRAMSKLADKEHPEWLSADTPFDQLVALASPSERAVLEGLSSQLNLSKAQRGQEVKGLADKIAAEKKKVEGQIRDKNAALGRAAAAIRRTLTNRWPELHNVWRPEVARLLQESSDEVVKTIEQDPHYAEFEKLTAELASLHEQKLDLDRRGAKCQRLLRTLENVALAANLPSVASEEVQQHYAQLVAAEHSVLGPKGAIAVKRDGP